MRREGFCRYGCHFPAIDMTAPMKSTTPLLAIDTLSTTCTVAVLDSDGSLHVRRGSGERRHAREVLSLVDGVLGDCGIPLSALSAIAVISGPGSFTGLRIGATVAQGLAFSAGLPVVPVSSLELLAMAAAAEQSSARLLCLFGARPAEYYYASCIIEDNLPRLSGRQHVGAFPSSARADGSVVVTDGATASALRNDPLAVDLVPEVVEVDAGVLARLAVRLLEHDPWISVPPARAVPVYIKDDLEYRKSGATGS